MEPITADLYPYPEGWYAIGFTDEFRTGSVVTRKFVGQEVVVWRTQSGTIAVSDPYCPHMGAHLGKGGTVQGEELRCPFHGFCFDPEGTCTSTGYGTKPNPKGKLRVWPSNEVNGIVMVYHHPEGEEPTWSIPELDMSAFTKMKHIKWDLDSHPQETSENRVDTGHFTEVHGYSGIETLESLRTEGQYLYSKYAMQRSAGFIGKAKLRAEFEVHVHGLGFSFVDARVPELGLRLNQFVLSTPIAPGKVELRIALAVEKVKKPAKINPVLILLPKKLTTQIIATTAFREFKHDVGQDFEIWNNKKYVTPPALAKGDGPVGQYRMWAKQFYPDKKEVINGKAFVA